MSEVKKIGFRISLGHKIFAVGGIGVLGILMIAGIYFVGTLQMSKFEKNADSAVTIRATMRSVDVSLLKARRAEKDFLLRNSDAYIKLNEQEIRNAGAGLNKLRDMLAASEIPAQVQQLDEIRSGVEKYRKDFNSMSDARRRLGLDENAGLQGTLRASVHAIESEVAKYNDPAALNAMLTMRRHEKDFMLRGDVRYGDQMKAAATQFKAFIERTNIPSESKESVLNKLSEYQRDFSGYMTATKSVSDEQANLSAGFAKLEPMIDRLTAVVTEAAVDARALFESTRAKMELVIEVAMVIILMFCGVVAFFVSRSITKPISGLVGELQKVADGNFNISVPWRNRKDEIGDMSNAVAEMASKVSSTIGEIRASGREVTNASAEISTSTSDLSQRTEEQAASLEETSAAMEEMSATVRKNSENAQIANKDASATRDVADRGGQIVAKAVDAMAKIEDSSRKISDIIGVIDEIARQTNLLALNAAVEAARAGDAGRGFAVVASEVRSLAQRSSQAAKDIKDLIMSSNGQVKDGVDLVNKAGDSLTEIVESINKVAAVVSDIANASIEQATGIEQINKALTQMDEVTQQNSALVEENAATAKTLEFQAKAMDEQVAFFQIGNAGDSVAAATAANRPARDTAKSKPVAVSAARKAAPVGAPRGNSGGPVQQMRTQLATAVKAEDWKEF